MGQINTTINTISPLSIDEQRQALQYVVHRGEYVAARLDSIDSFSVFTDGTCKRLFDKLRELTGRGIVSNLSMELKHSFSGESLEYKTAVELDFNYLEADAAYYWRRVELQDYKIKKQRVLLEQINSLSRDNVPFSEYIESDERAQALNTNYTVFERLQPVSPFTDCEFDWLLLDNNGIGTFAAGNVYQIAGLPKGGKSTFVNIIAASLLGCTDFGLHVTPKHTNPKILIFDTEMFPIDDANALHSIGNMAGLDMTRDNFDKIRIYNIRQEDDMLRAVVEVTQSYKPDIVFIDGINDLINDPNDLSESKAIVKKLNQFATSMGGVGAPVCIVWLMHLNQSEGAKAKKAGGHSGSQSTMKAAGGWIVSKHAIKDENERKGERYIFSAVNDFCRHQEIETIYFKKDGNTTLNAKADYEIYIKPSAEYAEQQAEQRKEINAIKTRNAAKVKAFDLCNSLDIWNGEPITRETFYNAYLPKVNGNKSNAARKLRTLIEQGIVTETENDLLKLNVLSLETPPF